MTPIAGDKIKIYSSWDRKINKDLFYPVISVFRPKNDVYYCLVAFRSGDFYIIEEMGPNLPEPSRALGKKYAEQHDVSFAIVSVDSIAEIKGYRSNVED